MSTICLRDGENLASASYINHQSIYNMHMPSINQDELAIERERKASINGSTIGKSKHN